MPVAARPIFRHLPAALALLSGPLLLGGCGSGDASVVSMVTTGSSASLFEDGSRLSGPGQIVRNATVEGLVGFDAEGRVVTALADRCIVT